MIILLAALAAPAAPIVTGQSGSDIVVTATLVPIPTDEAPPSVTLFDEERIEALGATLAADLIRLAPGVAVSISGGQGTQTQVRIRGAEANHTLVFIDGIAFNDLAANNQARFETFSADGLGRLEIIRGPQSALWGSEALGGVIAMDSPDPLGAGRGALSLGYGSDDSARGSAAFVSGGEKAGASATASWARSDGIDILGGGTGDKDGFENITAGLRAAVRPTADAEAGLAARYIHHDFEYDATDAFFRRADTADASTAETYALRGFARLGLGSDARWSGKLEAQYLSSENRNRIATTRTNDSYGRRLRFGGQAVRRFGSPDHGHELVAALEREEEDFGTRDLQFGGASDRDLHRGRTSLVGEWRARWSRRLLTDLAVRRDDFNRFQDETTIRGNAELKVSGSLTLVGGYGEGIAQPSFVDLFGFGANVGFIGNPALTPEKSRGYEAGLRWRRGPVSLEATAYSNALRDEIIEDFSFFPNYTVVNAPGRSRRRGIELSSAWLPAPGLRLAANYSYVDTRERSTAGSASLSEIRRPRHSANFIADWRLGDATIGASLAYVGARTDLDFDLFPAPRLRLDPYALIGLRIAYRLSRSLEAFGRIENAADAGYQDVIGYAAPGRKIHAGIRVRLGD